MTARFRPLAIELRVEEILKTAGVHNLDHATIDLECANDQLVFFHEMQHDVALTETNYGVILSLFRMGHRQARTPETGETLRQWTGELFRNAAHTLEVHATYLSIKQLPSVAIEEACSELPAAYRRYFETLSAVIDPVFPSTYTQFVIGKTVCEIALSSRLIETLLHWTPASAASIDAADSPDVRLVTLLEHLPEQLSRLRHELQRGIPALPFAAALGPRFDILNEEDWLSLPSSVAAQLDEWMLGVTRNRLYELAVGLFPCSMPDEWLAQRSRLADHISTFLSSGIVMRRNDTGTRAQREGRTAISNPVAVRPERIPVTDPSSLFFYETRSGDRRAYDNVIFVGGAPTEAEAKTTPREWRVFQQRGEQWYAFAIGHDDFLRVCRVQMVITASGLPLPFTGHIVAGLWANQTELHIQAMRDVATAYSLEGLQIVPPQVTWYAGGDFYSFYSYVAGLGGLRGSWINPYGERSELRDMSAADIRKYIDERPMGDSAVFFNRKLLAPMWFYFESPHFAGSFLRIMPAGADFRFITDDVTGNQIDVIPPAEAGKLWPRLLNLSAPLFASWSSL